MSEDKGKYIYTNKSKKLTFDLNELTDDERKKFNKLNDTQKRQFIAAFKLNEEVQFPDEIQVKTTKEYTPNERYNKLVNVKNKSDEIKKFIQRNPEFKDYKLKDIREILLTYTTHITADDLAQALSKNEDITISDLNKLYIDKVNELNISQAENVNISQANKVNFDKLLLDVNKLTSIIDDPLKNSLKEIVNKYSDNNEIIEAADKNDIAKLITELEKQRDTKLLDEIKGNIDYLQIQLDNIFGNVGMTQDEILEILKNKDDVKELKEMIKKAYKQTNQNINQKINTIIAKLNQSSDEASYESNIRTIIELISQMLQKADNYPIYQIDFPDNTAYGDLAVEMIRNGNFNYGISDITKNGADVVPSYKTTKEYKMLEGIVDYLNGIAMKIYNSYYMLNKQKFEEALKQLGYPPIKKQEGEGIKDFFKGVKNIPEIESMKNELIKINERLSKLETSSFQQPQQFPSSSTIITSQPEPSKPEFLNSITQPVKLKPIEIEADNGFKKTRQEEEQGILKDLSEIMSKRRQDLEPDEYEEEDDEWAEGLRKNNFKGLKLYSLNDLLSHN
jgi:hypothetical protein